MNRDHDLEAMPEVEAALRELAPLWSASARLPAAGDMLRRARLRQRELAAERLTRWHSGLRNFGLALLALAAAWAARGLHTEWAGWLVRPLVENPPLPGAADAAVLAGALLAASAAIIWVALQFAEE